MLLERDVAAFKRRKKLEEDVSVIREMSVLLTPIKNTRWPSTTSLSTGTDAKQRSCNLRS